MSASPGWLEPLVLLQDSGGDAHAYVERVHAIFIRDFVTSRPSFRGKHVLFDGTLENGKARAFTHITTKSTCGSDERVLSIRRCERIAWVRAVIEHADSPEVLVWVKEQQTKKRLATRTYLFLVQEQFLVILEELRHGSYLVTAIYVDNPRQHAKHLKAYEEYTKRSGHAA